MLNIEMVVVGELGGREGRWVLKSVGERQLAGRVGLVRGGLGGRRDGSEKQWQWPGVEVRCLRIQVAVCYLPSSHTIRRGGWTGPTRLD